MQVAMFLENRGFSAIHQPVRRHARLGPGGGSVHADLLKAVHETESCFPAAVLPVHRRRGTRGPTCCRSTRRPWDNDAQFTAAKHTLEAGREKLPQGRAGLLPTLGVSVNTMWNDVEYQRRVSGAAVATGQYNSHGYSVSLSQPLFRWQNWMQYDQAKLQVAQAEAQFLQARQDLILRVAQAYFDVLYAQENLRSLQAQKSAIAQQLETGEEELRGGHRHHHRHPPKAQSPLRPVPPPQEIAAEKRSGKSSAATCRPSSAGRRGELATLRTDTTLEPPKPAQHETTGWLPPRRTPWRCRSREAQLENHGQGSEQAARRSFPHPGTWWPPAAMRCRPMVCRTNPPLPGGWLRAGFHRHRPCS